MAAFDPQVPDVNPPDWTRVSRPIQQPESITKADTSTGILLHTGANVLEEGAKLYDTTEKSFLKDKVETGVNKLRDDYINAYQGIRDSQTLIPNQEQSLAEAQQPPVPGGLQGGITRLQQVAQAQIQNQGHVNDTLYTMQLNSLTKQLRNQYPGYKDYIDEQVKSVSGVDPANAVMKNLLEDINRNATNVKSEHDKVTAMTRDAVTQGLPNSPVIAALWAAGKITPDQVNAYIYKYSSADYQRKQEMADRTNDQGRLSDVVTATKQSFSRTAASDTQAMIDTIHIAGGTETAQGLVDVITKANSEGTKVDPIKLEQGLMGLTAMKTQAEASLWRKANEPDKNGNTTLSLIGEQEVAAQIKAQTAPIDSYIKYIADEKLGLAHTALRQATALGETAQRDLLVHKDIGQQLQIIDGMAKIAPQWGDAMYKAGLLTNLDKKLIPIYQEGLGRAATQLDPLNPATVKEDIQRAKAGGVQPNQRLVDNYLNIPKIIADPKAPDAVKLNVAKYAFDPKNWGMMDELKMDYRNQKGQYIPGKYSAYDRMLSTDIIDGMDKLRKQGGDGKVAWDNMKKWGENEFPVLFREDLQNIQRASNVTGDAKPMIGKYDIHWDSDGSRFLPINVTRDMPVDDQGRIKQINTVINRVNGALTQLGDIQKRDGGNTSAYILGVLHNADPALRPITQPMMTSIISAHDKKLQKLEDTFSADRK